MVLLVGSDQVFWNTWTIYRKSRLRAAENCLVNDTLSKLR